MGMNSNVLDRKTEENKLEVSENSVQRMYD